MNIRRALTKLATPQHSPDDAVALALAQGEVLVPLSPDACLRKTRGGTFLFEGLSIGLETFCNDPLGLLNITKAWQIVLSTAATHVQLPIDSDLLRMLTGIDIEERHVAAISPQRRAAPILMATDQTNTTYLIDGAHRLSARSRAGKKQVSAFILNPHGLNYIRVRMWRLNDDGTKSEIDTTKGFFDVAAHLMGASGIAA